MRQIEVTAPSVEQAVAEAMQELGAGRDRVKIEVLSDGTIDLPGLNAGEARIRATLAENPLEQQIQLASEVLTGLLYHLDLAADIHAEAGTVADEDEQAQPIVLDITGDELGILIGRRGQTLAALQYILRLMVTQKLALAVPLALDVNGYKKRRYDSLRSLAQHIAEQVTVSQRSFALEPMPAYERRIIHLALAEHPLVTTQSVGFGDARKVTVVPRPKQFSR